MKITEDTKIKDIIPEGYEIDDSTEGFFDKLIYFRLKTKPEKDFKWYYEEYLRRNREDLARWLTEGANDYTYDLFVGENYKEIEFEIRIGLLKFICDDLGLTLDDMYKYLQIYYIDDLSNKYDKIYSIVPHEFLDSLT